MCSHLWELHVHVMQTERRACSVIDTAVRGRVFVPAPDVLVNIHHGTFSEFSDGATRSVPLISECRHNDQKIIVS